MFFPVELWLCDTMAAVMTCHVFCVRVSPHAADTCFSLRRRRGEGESLTRAPEEMSGGRFEGKERKRRSGRSGAAGMASRSEDSASAMLSTPKVCRAVYALASVPAHRCVFLQRLPVVSPCVLRKRALAGHLVRKPRSQACERRGDLGAFFC